MLDKEQLKDLVKKAEDKDFVGFKEVIIKDVTQDVDVASKNYIDSGDAFDNFKKSKRFTSEANQDLNDVALDYYKKYKGKTESIEKALEDDGYELKEIAKVMKFIKEM